MNLFRRWKQHSVPCWCGAKAGERCRNRDGSTARLHDSRGVVTREQVDAMSKAAGLPPLPKEDK